MPPGSGDPCHLPTKPHRAASLLTLLALVTALTAAAAPDSAAPYLKIRDTSLGYHGAAEDFTGLTEIRLGWFGPDDPADPSAGDLWWAADLAVQEANARPRTPADSPFTALPVRLIPRWSADPWGSGVSLLARLVYDEQPLALLGSVDSASTHLAEQIVAKANLPLVSPIATDKTATLAGVSWMFSCAPDDTALARLLVNEILRRSPVEFERDRSGVFCGRGAPTPRGMRCETCTQPGEGTRPTSNQAEPKQINPKSQILLLATTDHDSRMTAREIMRELGRRGTAPAFRFDLPPGGTVDDGWLRAIGATPPTAILVIAGAEDAARLTRTIRENLGAVPILGGPSMGRSRFLALAGPAAEGVRFPLLFVPEPADEAAAGFAARFRAERGHDPDYAAALTYDATRLLIAAILRAGPNRARIRTELGQPDPWPGIAGPIRFDGTGQNRRTDLALGTVRQGAVIAVTAPPAPAAILGFAPPR